jgi:hypothetical protein
MSKRGIDSVLTDQNQRVDRPLMTYTWFQNGLTPIIKKTGPFTFTEQDQKNNSYPLTPKNVPLTFSQTGYSGYGQTNNNDHVNLTYKKLSAQFAMENAKLKEENEKLQTIRALLCRDIEKLHDVKTQIVNDNVQMLKDKTIMLAEVAHTYNNEPANKPNKKSNKKSNNITRSKRKL